MQTFNISPVLLFLLTSYFPSLVYFLKMWFRDLHIIISYKMTSSMILFIFCLFFLGTWHLDTISDTRKSSKQNSQIEIINIYIKFTFQSSFHCSPLFSFPTLLVLLQVIPGSIYILDFVFLEILIFSNFLSKNGTCYTSSQCTSKGGSADGRCAAGFGVCCVIVSSTCGSIISNNISYIRNPGYPSSYTPTTTGTCTFTINKSQSDVCQLRLDFDTFSGWKLF